MRQRESSVLLLLLLLYGASPGVARAVDDEARVRPLARAHAHNDYEHARPLLDALSHGFTSVEADVFAIDGKLLVAHDLVDVRPDRTLQALYLDPLLERVRRNGGSVHAGGGDFTLLVDFKSAGEVTYRELARVLEKYAEMLTSVREGKVAKKAVTVVISGNRPWKLIAAQKLRYAGVDGRLSDLDSTHPAHLMPLISDHWGRNFRWRGAGPMPAAEREKLRKVVKKAHGRGCRVRFWATPDRAKSEAERLRRAALWKELVAAGVDHLNTDDLPGLQKFLLAQARGGKKIKETRP